MIETHALRFADLEPHETVRAYCTCGRIVEFLNGVLDRNHHIPLHMPVADLQYRLRCTRCRAVRGFKITIFDERGRGVNSRESEQVIVEGGL